MLGCFSNTYGDETLYGYLRDGHNFSLDLSDFVLSLHVIPELRLSKASVLSENSHSVELGVGVLFRRKTSANHEVLSDLKGSKRKSYIRLHGCYAYASNHFSLSIMK